MLKISDRLIQVAGLVPEGARLADVGTDHGYVPIWLLQNKRIASAIAMDVNRGPLLRAAENRDKYGFKDKIELRLSDGLEKLEPGEADAVLIAGMGGPLMVRILDEGRGRMSDVSSWILQPQSEIPSVRRYLITHDFQIVDEIMLMDDGKYYMAMRAVPGQEAAWSETEYLFGKQLLRNRHPVLRAILEKEKNIYTGILNQLEESHQTGTSRYSEVKTYLEELDRGMAYYIE
jgi:tRNA (adenine22-N1)-methyltransferase